MKNPTQEEEIGKERGREREGKRGGRERDTERH